MIYLQATKLIFGAAVIVFLAGCAAPPPPPLAAADDGFGFRTVGSALGIGLPNLVCSLTTF